MDLNNFSRLMERKKDVREKTFLLGALTYPETGEIEILDPYNQPRQLYSGCLSIIVSSMQKIEKNLR
jgi:hypothetical protein